MQQRSYILQKLNAFHMEHNTLGAEILSDLQKAAEQVPVKEHAAEAKPLQEQLNDLLRKKRPQPLSDILLVVLARLGLGSIQSPESGEADLTWP